MFPLAYSLVRYSWSDLCTSQILEVSSSMMTRPRNQSINDISLGKLSQSSVSAGATELSGFIVIASA